MMQRRKARRVRRWNQPAVRRYVATVRKRLERVVHQELAKLDRKIRALERERQALRVEIGQTVG
jgi:hypothetical protein